MHRDMDLIRYILLRIEELPADGDIIHFGNIENYTQEQIFYHVKLLAEAGFVEAINFKNDWYPKSLTWSGHEFLDAARHDTIWNKAKKIISDKGGSIPFAVLQSLLLELAKQALNLT